MLARPLMTARTPHRACARTSTGLSLQSTRSTATSDPSIAIEAGTAMDSSNDVWAVSAAHQQPRKPGQQCAALSSKRGHAVTRPPSTRAYRPLRLNSADIVIEMQQHAETQAYPADPAPALGRAPSPSRPCPNSQGASGSGSTADRNGGTGAGPLPQTSGASILRSEHSDSESFQSARNFLEPLDTPPILHEHPIPPTPQAHTPALAAATAATTPAKRLGTLAASIRTGAAHGVRTALGPKPPQRWRQLRVACA